MRYFQVNDVNAHLWLH